MRLQPIAFARAHHYAAATDFRARVDATSMGERAAKDVGGPANLYSRSWTVGVNAESVK